jgi:hypothetical protein
MPQALWESRTGGAYPFCAAVIRFAQEIRKGAAPSALPAEAAAYGG